MKISKKHIATGMLAIGLATTAGAGITAAAEGEGFNRGDKGGHAKVVATLLGVSVEDFQARVQNGEKPHEILEAAGLSREDVKAAHEAQRAERIAQAIADGRMTQEEADERAAKHAQRTANFEAARTAIENNDYSAWVSAIANSPREATVEVFNKLVQAHQLRESGDMEGARELMKTLGKDFDFKPHPRGEGRNR